MPKVPGKVRGKHKIRVLNRDSIQPLILFRSRNPILAYALRNTCVRPVAPKEGKLLFTTQLKMALRSE